MSIFVIYVFSSEFFDSFFYDLRILLEILILFVPEKVYKLNKSVKMDVLPRHIFKTN